MKRAKTSILLATLVALLLASSSGCIYSNVRTPLDTDLDETTLGTKVGEASYTSLFGLFAWGDAGTAAAARNGGITTLRHMDRHILAVLWFVYFRQTTIVYGE